LIAGAAPGIVRAGSSGDEMRFQVVMALAIMAPLTACGMFGPKEKPAPSLDNGELITKPIGPGLVSRCPVPADYDDATLKQITDALQTLPPDNILHKIMQDYETERDNLRMCQ
jgi:predicted small lipoprotein YifL